MNFERIKKLRIEKGMTQQDVANILNISEYNNAAVAITTNERVDSIINSINK